MDLPWQYPDFRSCTTYIEGAYKNGWVSQGVTTTTSTTSTTSSSSTRVVRQVLMC